MNEGSNLFAARTLCLELCFSMALSHPPFLIISFLNHSHEMLFLSSSEISSIGGDCVWRAMPTHIPVSVLQCNCYYKLPSVDLPLPEAHVRFADHKTLSINFSINIPRIKWSHANYVATSTRDILAETNHLQCLYQKSKLWRNKKLSTLCLSIIWLKSCTKKTPFCLYICGAG